MRPAVRIGTSGYVYDHWRGTFYPERLPRSRWFAYYAERFRTVEINNTHYRLPTGRTVERWKADAPEGFSFVFKAHRYITHYRRLLRPEEPLAKMFSALKPLREQTGAVLFQLPEQVQRDDDRLREFLRKLPHGWHHAFEFRSRSWFADEVFDLLGEHGVAFCIHDWPSSRPVPKETTADLVYVRFHGPEHAYAGLYGSHRLTPWLKRIEAWRLGRHRVLAYFNNDPHAYATQDAAWLARRAAARAREAPAR